MNLRRSFCLRFVATWLIALLLAGCTHGSAPSTPAPEPPPRPVTVELPAELSQRRDALVSRLDDAMRLDPAAFRARHEVAFTPSLGYVPSDALNFDLVQGSALSLEDDERASLDEHGFVVTERHRFPSFAYGYQTIYQQDLPVYITADAILEAVHRSYRDILKVVEGNVLRTELEGLLSSMRATLASDTSLSELVRRDADVFLAVALGLLKGAPVGPVAGGSTDEIARFSEAALDATGEAAVSVFGTPRDVDFSQFEPRGHYADSPELSQYFRAMTWLGRIDFRFLETQPDQTRVLRRRQVEAAIALRTLMNDDAMASWRRIDRIIGGFVGAIDSMQPTQIDALLSDLGLTLGASLDAIGDDALAAAIVARGYGEQRISSDIMINGLPQGTMPLSASFTFLGQRYTPDAHVLSNVVYDRVARGAVMRMMPNPLDVAYAAFGNDQAAALLTDEMATHSYAGDLEAMRILVDEQAEASSTQSLYGRWTASLRTLSPRATMPEGERAGLPTVATTEAWGRRLLNTQMASWAELRHDNILYVKQSYTAGNACEFPDAYVDPYPEFFRAIGAFAEHASTLMPDLGRLADDAQVRVYFSRLATVADRLEQMARQQRDGIPFDEDQMAFVNDAVRVSPYGCDDTSVRVEGWYSQLNYDSSDINLDPTIADIHTQPREIGGAIVGRVLHVGTGMPRAMVVTIETCSGPRAYVGIVSSYFERTTEQFHRLTDVEWSAEVSAATPEDVSWMRDIVAR